MSRSQTISIAGRKIGSGEPPFIVAELSGNHNGDINRALALIEVAKRAGADAVKLQTYTADTMTLDCDRPDFQIATGPWAGRSLHDLYVEAHTPWDWHEALFAKGRELDIPVFSTPFDFTAVDYLESLDTPAYKIASFELVDLPLIAKVAGKGKPMIMSTGMADVADIEDALAAARGAGCRDIVLLHCVSGYPTPARQYNLHTIQDIARRFDVVAGLSDHTLSSAVSVAAVGLGAALIEKHITLARADGGPDAGFSLEPSELTALCADCRAASDALGKVDYERKPSEQENVIFRRSLYVVADVKAGQPLTADNVRSIRPGFGLRPKHLPEVLGRRAKTDIARGTALSWELLD